jgi:hypothetical protein
VDASEDGVVRAEVAVGRKKSNGLLVDFGEEIETGDDEVLAGEKLAMGERRTGYARSGGYVTRADILFKG